MGLTQHKNSVPTIQEISKPPSTWGNVEKDGAGLCPVRGHSNVQGDRMGINHDPNSEFLDSLIREFGIKVAIQGIRFSRWYEEHVRSGSQCIPFNGWKFHIGNCSDTNVTAKAIRNCSLTVQINQAQPFASCYRKDRYYPAMPG